MGEFISGLSIGFFALIFILANADTNVASVDLSLKIGNALCKEHKGLKSFDYNEYTCIDNTAIKPAEPHGWSKEEVLKNLEQNIDK